MKRADFYIEYYNTTDRAFSDKIVWGKKEREVAWRKGQHLTSKLERKIFIVIQYLILLSCWVPMCFDRGMWMVIPFALLWFLLQMYITDFSVIKIEILYAIYRSNNIFCSVLYDIFLGNVTDFFNKLQSSTKEKVTGYVFQRGGKFYGTYIAVCRNRDDKISITFKKNSVLVVVNEKIYVIKEAPPTKEHLIIEMATIINH